MAAPLHAASLLLGGSLARHVPMDSPDLVPIFREPLAKFVSHHHRSMLAARAAKSDCQIALSFADIVGQQITKQIGNPKNEFLRLWKTANISSNAGMSPGQWLELRDVVRIWKEAYIEYQVRVGRDPMSEPETCNLDHDSALFAASLELPPNKIA